jgi:hypothetical protein
MPGARDSSWRSRSSPIGRQIRGVANDHPAAHRHRGAGRGDRGAERRIAAGL